jgi:DNA polymerase-3 subunit gamma/tau
VLSRCLQFNLKQMAPAHIHQHLSHILAAETIAFEPAALHHLAQAAAGSMRDALSLLDQAIAHGGGKVEEAQVAAMLGMVGDEHLHGLLDALAAGDVAALIGIADAMEARSLSFDAALQGLARLLQRIALAQYAPAAIADEPAHERIVAHAERFDAEFLQLAYQIAIHGREELSLAPDEYTGFTMALLRLHAFRPEQPAALGSSGVVAGGSGQARTLPAPTAPQGTPAPAAAPLASSQPTAAVPASVAVSPPPAVQSPVVPPAVPPTPAVPPPPAVTPPPAVATVPTPKPDEGGSDVPPWEELPPEAYGEFAASSSPVPPVAVPVSAAPVVAPPAAAVEPPAERDASLQPAQSVQSVQSVVTADAAKAAASAAAVPSADPAAAAQAVRLFAAGDWAGLIRCAGLSGMQRELAQHCAWQGLDGEVLHLQLAPAHRHLIDLDQSLSIRLQEQLASLLARPALRLRIEVAEAIGETPAQRAAEERRQRQLAAQAALEADPFVRELRARFDAALVVDSIRPCVEPA